MLFLAFLQATTRTHLRVVYIVGLVSTSQIWINQLLWSGRSFSTRSTAFDGPINAFGSCQKHSPYMQVRPIDSVHLSGHQLIVDPIVLRHTALLGALLAGTYGLAKGKGRAISTVFAASAAVNSGVAGATFFSAFLPAITRWINLRSRWILLSRSERIRCQPIAHIHPSVRAIRAP